MLKDQFWHLLQPQRLKISSTDLSRITTVSPSQVRYWERKGYLHAEQGQTGQKHYFSLPAVFQASIIKHFLNKGYTLRMAVQKEHQHRRDGQVFRQFLTDRIMAIPQTGIGKGVIKLGPLADDSNQEVYAQVEINGKTTLHLRSLKKRKQAHRWP